MKIKRLYAIMLLSVISILTGGCNKTEESQKVMISKISDLSYSADSGVEPILFLKEKDGYCPYLVLKNNYNGNTLLLRKEVLPASMRISDYNAYYENSEMDKFLNEEFLAELPKETKDIIKESKIEILDKKCLGMVEDDVITISRKVFLLSFIELGYANNGSAGREGSPLTYFKENSNRLAYTTNGTESVSWWLRSADSTYDSCVYAVGPKGELGSTNAFSLNGVRPAFCVDGNLTVEKKDGKYIVSINP